MQWTPFMPISPPAVWGKLPTHADYVGQNNRLDQAQQWQRWLYAHASEYVASTEQRQTLQRGSTPMKWIQLDVHPIKIATQKLPVSFILPPGQLPFSGDQYVVGVLIASHDAIGRHHPLVVYHVASKKWLSQYLGKTSRDARDWQYWLGRWLTHMQYLIEQKEAIDTRSLAQLDIYHLLTKGVSALWRLHQPGLWTRLLGSSSKSLLLRESELVLEQMLSMHQLPTKLMFPMGDHLLKGVMHLPWIDWPDRLLTKPKAMPTYWQQDDSGRYIKASEQLSSFYKASMK